MSTAILINRTDSMASRKAEFIKAKLHGKTCLRLRVEFRQAEPKTGEFIRKGALEIWCVTDAKMKVTALTDMVIGLLSDPDA